MEASRKIIHIDMDAFYASVEQRDHPELRGKPIAVGGSSRRGVVASASYEARKYGVRSAMPSITARRLCPELVFVKSRFDVYRSVSRQIRALFFEYTDLVEPLSLDEAYLDVTEPLRGPRSATLIAAEIRERIEAATGLTASAGISFNKFLAKVASDINKPNGMKVIPPEEALAFLEQMEIEAFHGIGKVTAAKMRRMGIFTGKDLKRLSEIEMVRRFGKVGRHYYRIVRAEDHRPVNPNRIRKSIGAERTFKEDLTATPAMVDKLAYLCQVVHQYMTKADNFGRTLTLKAKTPDFKILTRSRTLSREVRELDEMVAIITGLFREHRAEIPSARLLGVSVSNLVKEQVDLGVQLELDFERGVEGIQQQTEEE